MQIPFTPMEPVLVDTPPDGDGYIFQVKWDGVRLIIDKSDEGVRLFNRHMRQKTALYPEVVEAIRELATPDLLLDGELISLDKGGRPSFHQVLKRDLAKQAHQAPAVCFVAFDCLRHGTEWLQKAPLATRQQALQDIPNTGLIQVTENFIDGNMLFGRMQELEMEGIVAKQSGSLYYPGERRNVWQKVKCWRYLWLSVTGVKWQSGRPSSLQAALLDNPQIQVGTVASGLTQADWKRILGYVIGTPDRTGMSPVHPGMVIHVRFLEWTNDGRLRAPSVLELRTLDTS